ncbi:MAG: nitroreductase family protein [Candidatus Competibacteraceae bacterium]|nr:nitroreductase family protein [Candidatus Competibacteraceae bacterium]
MSVLPDPASVAGLLEGRRTIHDFRPEPVPRETVLKAIELACWAPNHRMTEPWRFYLLGPETVAGIIHLNAQQIAAAKGPKVARAKAERWGRIPGWLVLTCANSDDPVQSREDLAACACAAHNLSLYLWSEGIGVKWTTGVVTRMAEFYDLIWADPQAETVVGMFWYGYPLEVPQTARRPVGEVLVQLP